MTARDATVRNAYGIHCRPSALIAKAAQEYAGDITIAVTAKGAQADAKSMLLLMGLGIRCGDVVKVTVAGDDEEKMLERMVGLFEKDFDFPRDD